MTVSVILSAYNGEKYIYEQLNSLYEQDRKIDEVIIIDDFSSDNTCEIIESFICDRDLINWRLIKNNWNKGWKINFFEGFQTANADIVFPCDQDDIWHRDKVSKMSSILEKNANIMVLEGRPHKFFDNRNYKGNLRSYIGTILDRNEIRKTKHFTGEVSQKIFSSSFMRRAPGCTLAFRKCFFDNIKGEWFPNMPHDALLTYYPNVLGVYYIYDNEVIEWRQHIGSASRPVEHSVKKRIEEIELDGEIIESLLSFSKKNKLSSDVLDVLEKAKKWNRSRGQMVCNGDLSKFNQLVKYSGFYTQKRRLLTDLKYGIDSNSQKKRCT